MASPLLDVHHLTVSYPMPSGPLRAIRDVSFQIASGETLALVGETGCGKSTLALSLLGLLDRQKHIESGRILFEGQDLLLLGARKWRKIRGQKVGMIFQDPRSSLNPVLTIGEHLVESVRAHQDISKARAREHAMELLSDVGIPDPKLSMRRYAFELSGGMCQRVGIALGICNKPRLLIADEPTSALDLSIQAQILELLRVMQRRHNLALLLISHDLALVSEFTDRIAVMYHGRFVETGIVGETFGSPGHPYTRALVECQSALMHRRERQPLPSIVGAPARLSEEFPGCAFAPRCPLAEPECANGLPPPIILSNTHWAACIKANHDGK